MQHPGAVAEYGQRVLCTNKNVAADHRIESAAWLPFMNVGLEAFDVFNAIRGRARFQFFKRRPIEVHRSHASMPPDHSGSENRNVTDAAADIQNLHSPGDPCPAEELL